MGCSNILGESLLNDGTSIVLFEIFRDSFHPHGGYTVGSGIVFGLRLALGGPFVGIVVGK